MSKLILIRHGQSTWNAANRFTGWVDVPLSEQGVEEALKAGEQLSNTRISTIFTSTLMRAQQTAMLVMSKNHVSHSPLLRHPNNPTLASREQIHQSEALENVTPVTVAWELNERCYGDLQGLDKDETRQKFGADQVKIWRRSFDVPPPGGESLKDTAARTIPYFEETIIPALKTNDCVLVSAHGNSLRSIIMFIEQLSNEEVLNLECATGEPMIYDFEQSSFTRVSNT